MIRTSTPPSSSLDVEGLRRPSPRRGHTRVTHQVRAQAAANPLNAAVETEDGVVSYRDLLERVDALSGAVAARISAGDPVAILAPASPGYVVAMLAVMDAGGVACPIAVNLPVRRAGLMLDALDPSLVISVDDAEQGFDQLAIAAPALRLDRLGAQIADVGPRADLRPGAEDAAPAYVFFTSGSTGRPKGILGRHDALAQWVGWQRTEFDIQSSDRVAMLAPLTFDVTLRDIFLPLTVGGTVCVPPRLGADQTLPWLADSGITVVHTSPARLELWLAATPDPIPRHSLRWIFSSGDILRGDLVQEWHERCGNSGQLVNLYGTTETTLARCFHRVSSTSDIGPPVPVGRPVADTEIFVVDGAGRECRQGHEGDVVFRTAYATLGYLDQGDDPEGRFSRNPHSDDPFDIVYRTGDRGLIDASGDLVVFGRWDDQLQLGGVRIEAAEVTTHLARHEAVRQAAVIPVGDVDDRRLVGYVCLVDEGATTPEALRLHLRDWVPAGAVPGHIVFIDELPLTPNGKLDRNALPRPGEPHHADDRVGTLSDIERHVIAIWSDVLGCPVALGDNYFELGGTSLRALQIIARIGRELRRDVSVTTFFTFQDARSFAAAVDGLPVDTQRQVEDPAPTNALGDLTSLDDESRKRLAVMVRARLAERGSEPRHPLSFAQERLWFLEQMTPGLPTYNITMAFRLEGPLDDSALEEAFTRVIERHEALRTRFQDNGRGVAYAATAPPWPMQFERIDLSNEHGPASDAVIETTIRDYDARVFDLSDGRPLRVALARLGPDDHVVIPVVHHIISDGWSMQILLSEVAAIYGALVGGTAPDLPVLEAQQGEYTRWERENAASGAYDSDLEYWYQTLRDVPPLSLPYDHPLRTRDGRNAASIDIETGPGYADALQRLSSKTRSSPFMGLLSAYAMMLAQVTGDSDITIGVASADRSWPASRNMINYLVNTIALRVDVREGITFRELVSSVRSVALDAYGHASVPFDHVVAKVNPPRDPRRSPIYQVMFQGGEPFGRDVTFAGLERTRIRVAPGGIKTDVSTYLWADDDRIVGRLGYDADRFDPGTGQRMAAGLLAALEHGLDLPDAPIQVAARERRAD